MFKIKLVGKKDVVDVDIFFIQLILWLRSEV